MPRNPDGIFPSALSPEAHAEWGLYKILEYMGLHEILPPGAGKNRAKLRKDIEEYHIAYAIDFDDSIIDTFIARRPDGLAFDTEKKLCVLLDPTPLSLFLSLPCNCAGSQRPAQMRVISDSSSIFDGQRIRSRVCYNTMV